MLVGVGVGVEATDRVGVRVPLADELIIDGQGDRAIVAHDGEFVQVERSKKYGEFGANRTSFR